MSVSRWERNNTTPNTIKAIKVLRELTLDLKPFLLSIPSPEDETFLDDILYTRFRSQRSLLMMSDYEELKPSEEIEITEETLFEDEVDAHLTRLKNFSWMQIPTILEWSI